MRVMGRRKVKTESFYFELIKLCTLVNPHLDKKSRVSPKSLIEQNKKDSKKDEMTGDQKMDFLKGMINSGQTADKVKDKIKAEETIKELIRQGKLKK